MHILVCATVEEPLSKALVVGSPLASLAPLARQDLAEAPQDLAEEPPQDCAEAPQDLTEAPQDLAEAPHDLAEACKDLADAWADSWQGLEEMLQNGETHASIWVE